MVSQSLLQISHEVNSTLLGETLAGETFAFFMFFDHFRETKSPQK